MNETDSLEQPVDSDTPKLATLGDLLSDAVDVLLDQDDVSNRSMELAELANGEGRDFEREWAREVLRWVKQSLKSHYSGADEWKYRAYRAHRQKRDLSWAEIASALSVSKSAAEIETACATIRAHARQLLAEFVQADAGTTDPAEIRRESKRILSLARRPVSGG